MSSTGRSSSGHFNMLYFAGASSYTAKDQEALPAPLPLGRLFDTLEERYTQDEVEMHMIRKSTSSAIIHWMPPHSRHLLPPTCPRREAAARPRRCDSI
ncbi:Molybdopterin synthase sulfur carrier subunit like protein [Verticillium longisporum]|nr:Molybdopterin synthase sulfur carrier subunit like protein [Verticillium longisporum]